MRERLRQAMNAEFEGEAGPMSAMAKRLGVPKSTVSGWFDNPDPKCPDPDALIRIARRMNVSLDWLLDGYGRMKRQPAAGASVEDVVYERVVAELRASDGVEDKEIDLVVPLGKDMLRNLVKQYRAALAANRAMFNRLVAQGLRAKPMQQLIRSLAKLKLGMTPR